MNLAKLIGILIKNNRYEYGDMYSKLDLFFSFGRITIDEYKALTAQLVKPIN